MAISTHITATGGENLPDLSHLPPSLVEMARDVFDPNRSGMLGFIPYPHQVEGSDTLVAGVLKVDEPVPPIPERLRGWGYDYRLSTVELSPRGLEVSTHYRKGACTERCVGYLLTADSVVDTNQRPFVSLGGRPDPSEQFDACVAGAVSLLDEILSTPSNHDPIYARVGASSGQFARYFSRHNLSGAVIWLLNLGEDRKSETAPAGRPPAA